MWQSGVVLPTASEDTFFTVHRRLQMTWRFLSTCLTIHLTTLGMIFKIPPAVCSLCNLLDQFLVNFSWDSLINILLLQHDNRLVPLINQLCVIELRHLLRLEALS